MILRKQSQPPPPPPPQHDLVAWIFWISRVRTSRKGKTGTKVTRGGKREGPERDQGVKGEGVQRGPRGGLNMLNMGDFKMPAYLHAQFGAAQ